MSLRSPLGKVRGLGSAKEGVAHWWAQRMTAVALVPLLIWFVASICAMADAEYNAVRDWIATPMVSIMLVLMTVAVFHHAQLGLQVVLEDYVHTEWRKIASIAIVKFTAIGLAVATIFSIVKIALG
ncbi:MAG: succinate dehydrogenase, hydrophobic membrane anchor protein [Rhodospirillaceae bacterium]|nr:succinate dehydrogenase, hydrophobic membrane anchor protein [Rhodospirillaceae bacterium]|tara:strand:+ start:303 stop:680 length:378 start_codon:yes stop_codon:yes gene_type:complete